MDFCVGFISALFYLAPSAIYEKLVQHVTRIACPEVVARSVLEECIFSLATFVTALFGSS